MTDSDQAGCPFSGGGKITAGSLTYDDYLHVNDLKELQVCQSKPPHHDEPLFIIIHQTYELWFKLILHELDLVINFLDKDKIRRAIFFMRRINAIMHLLVGQIHVLETMSPMEFLGFRDNLNPASGFQSTQFREIEIVAGLRDHSLLEHFRHDQKSFQQLKRRLGKPSLEDSFYAFLRRQGFKMLMSEQQPAFDAGVVQAELVENCQANRLQELRKLYENLDDYNDCHDLAETLVDFDEHLALWRAHHVIVVERVIGFKEGTGGSEGVHYLRSTLNKRCFPDLWKVRTVIEYHPLES